MQYIAKEEVMEYLEGKQKEMILQGKEGTTITEIINHINGFYTYRPTLQAQWIRKNRGDFIYCSRCGFKTLVYKNSKYCPNCGKMMANGKAYDEK